MRTIYKNKRVIMIFMACCLVFSFVLQCMEVHAAPAKPVFSTEPYHEFVYGSDVRLSWTQPGDQPARYIVNIRKLSEANETTSVLIVKNFSTTNKYYVIFSSLLPGCSLYRASVCAEYSDGTKKYSDELYFFVSAHNLNTIYPVSFKIWSEFTTDTKYAVYYATRKWIDRTGMELVNTYNISNSYTGVNDINRDGINAVTGKSVGTNQHLMTTRYWDSRTNPVEFDININKSHPWVNSAQSGKFDVQSCMVHEIGHVLGLSHKYEQFAYDWSMYGYLHDGSIDQRTPDAEDIACFDDLHS